MQIHPLGEWAYDRESHIGRLDRGFDEAHEKGWTVVDMKHDWEVVFALEKTHTTAKWKPGEAEGDVCFYFEFQVVSFAL